jgi:hypothetical protein
MDEQQLADRLERMNLPVKRWQASAWPSASDEAGNVRGEVRDGRKVVAEFLVGLREGEIVMRQLDVMQQRKGMGATLLAELCEIALEQELTLCMPCSYDGSFVWSHLGVRCTEPDPSFRWQVMDNLDEMEMSDEAREQLREQLGRALRRKDPVRAVREVAGDELAPSLLEDAQWIGRMAGSELAELSVSLQQRLRPTLGSLDKASAAQAVPESSQLELGR